MADANLPHMPLSRSVPRFWTWRAPQGRAAKNPYIVKMVHPVIDDDHDAVHWAGQVVDEIENRGLSSSSICILLQNFGSNDVQGCTLGLHPDDAIDDGNGNTSINSIYTANGRAECLSWMEDFIEEFTTQTEIVPARFHFDSERMPVVNERSTVTNWFPITNANGWSQGQQPWDVMLADSRAGTNGQSDGEALFDGLNLATLWDDAQSEFDMSLFDPNQNWWHNAGGINNRPFSLWYQGLCKRVGDRAMAHAAYEPIHAEWPDTLCSNYYTSVWLSRQWPWNVTNDNTWFSHWQDAEADMQAPYCYPVDAAWITFWPRDPLGPMENLQWSGYGILHDERDAWMHHARTKLLASLYNGGGRPLAPWLMNIGETERGLTCGFTEMYLLVLWSWQCGAREFLIWDADEPDEADWNALHGLVNRLVYEKSSRNRLRLRRR